MEYDSMKSERMQWIRDNAIREILAAAARPGMISMAGGVPAEESFPLDILPSLFEETLAAYGPLAFQYGPTEGFGPLREALAGHLARRGLRTAPGGVIVTSGAQGALDGLGKTLISPGDVVAVEAPTYLGALQAFSAYRPEFAELRTDDSGVDPDSLDSLLRNRPVKFIYLNPTFQNPTGRTLDIERRARVAELIRRHGVLLIEDDPYGDLCYSGTPLPPIASLAPEQTVYVGTLSKVFAPGFRIGFCVAPAPVLRWLVKAKQGVDLHSSALGQAMAALYIESGRLERRLPLILNLYRERLEAMLRALDRHMPPGFTWTQPRGGMFVWVRGPRGFDAGRTYEKALNSNVAYVPGQHFFANTPERETMRLNFTAVCPELLNTGIRTLSRVIRESMLLHAGSATCAAGA